MPKDDGSSGSDTSCWCCRPSHSAEVECTACRHNVHYECLGISINDLSILMNQDPGLYLCKNCTATNKKTREGLLKKYPGNTIFEFNSRCYSVSENQAQDSVAAVAPIEIQLKQLNSVLTDLALRGPANPRPSLFSEVLTQPEDTLPKLQGSKPFVPTPPKGGRSVPQQADPTRTIVISRVDDVARFLPPRIKESLTSIRPSCEQQIRRARLLNNGKLLIEATTESACKDLAKGWPKDYFGSRALIQHLNTPSTSASTSPQNVWLIARNVCIGSDPEILKTQFQRHYDSIDKLTVLPAKDGRRTTVAKFCASAEEAEQICLHGCFAEFQHYRVFKAGPRPMRCFKCQRFGHVASVCRSAKRCVRCGSDDPSHPSECNEPPHCCNCEGSHAASSSECSTFRQRLRAFSSDYNR